MKNAEFYNFDLTAKNSSGETGFKIAENKGNTDIVNLIIKMMPDIAK